MENSKFNTYKNEYEYLPLNWAWDMKKNLRRLGYGGLDNSVTTGLKQFQKDNGLEIDGKISPGDKTDQRLTLLAQNPQNYRQTLSELPDTSDLSLREELEGRFNGSLPIVKTDPQTGFRSVYYLNDNEDEEETTQTPFPEKKKSPNYFQLPEDCHNPQHDLRIHGRRLNRGGDISSIFAPDHTGYSLVSTCDDGRKFINMQDLEKANGDKIVFAHTYSPAEDYQTDNGIITWSNQIPEEQKNKFDSMLKYLNAKNASHKTLAEGNTAATIYNLMGFENELINTIPDKNKPEYNFAFDNCNTSTQWKKDNYFPKWKQKTIRNILKNGVWGDELLLGYNNHYQAVDAAREALVDNNPNIDFSTISDIQWSDKRRSIGKTLQFSDDRNDYKIYMNPYHQQTYYAVVRPRKD